MGLELFLRENCQKAEKRRVVISERFQENGVPVEWVLRPITAAKEEEIRRSCTENGGLDVYRYCGRLCEESVLYPDLKNASLQDSYGVMGGAALLKAMLNGGEYVFLVQQVEEVNGFGQSERTLADEAKN